MRKLYLALALAIGLTACQGGGAPPPSVPPAPPSRQVTTLPPAVEQSAAAICTAYPEVVIGLARLGRAGRLNQSQVSTVDRVKASLDPACRGNITAAVLSTISANFGLLMGVQAAAQGSTP